MKGELNNGLQAPEPHSEDAYEKAESAREWAADNFKPEELFDLYNHDREVATTFGEYLGWNYSTFKLDGKFVHQKQGGKDNGRRFTSEQVWEIYCTETKK